MEVERRWGAEPERRRNRRVPVLERVLRSQEIDLEVAAGEVTERQHRLDGGDSGAGNQYPIHAQDRRALPRPAHPRLSVTLERGNTEQYSRSAISLRAPSRRVLHTP